MAPETKSLPAIQNIEHAGNICRANISGDGLFEAEGYLRCALELTDEEISAEGVCEALRRRKPTKLFSPTRHKEYLCQMTSAYALTLVIERSEIGPAIAEQLRDEQGVRRKGADDPVLLALRSRIDYSGNDEEEERQGRSQLSRDAGSVRYLRERNVSPNDVIALSKQRGEGKAQWYARYRESKQRNRPAPLAEPTIEVAVAAPGLGTEQNEGQFAIALVRLDIGSSVQVLNRSAVLPRGVSRETLDALWGECVEFLNGRARISLKQLFHDNQVGSAVAGRAHSGIPCGNQGGSV